MCRRCRNTRWWGPTWGRVGLIDIDYGYGGDEVPRWVPLFAQTPNPTLYHLSLQLALMHFGLDETAVRNVGDALEIVRPGGEVVTHIPLTAGQLVEVNWFGRWEDSPHASLADVLIARDQLDADKAADRAEARRFFAGYKDAIVLIGPTDALLQDLAPTPFHQEPVPRVGVHGNMVKTIVSGLYLRHLPEWSVFAIFLVLTLAVAGLSVSGGARSVFAKILAVLPRRSTWRWRFSCSRSCNWSCRSPRPSALLSPPASPRWYGRSSEEEKQKGRIKGMFGTYLSPELVHRMVESGEDPKLGGHEEEITAYFSDIQSFSTFSEK